MRPSTCRKPPPTRRSRRRSRNWARKYHPDLRPDDKDAIGRFKEISAANNLLKDPETRRRFDAGEIDAAGAETRAQRPQQPFYRDCADGPGHAAQDGFADAATMEEFLARAFGGQRGGPREPLRARGQDVKGSVFSTEARPAVELTVQQRAWSCRGTRDESPPLIWCGFQGSRHPRSSGNWPLGQ